MEIGDLIISKKIPITKNFNFYTGICFFLRYTSLIITDKGYEDYYYHYYPKKPYEFNLKFGLSESIEYNINRLLLKFLLNSYYTYYEFSFISMNENPYVIFNEFYVSAHYFVFQFFLLLGLNIKKKY